MTWRDDPEHLRMEQKFRATNDLRFAALAVGRWHAYGGRPENAPVWALEACAAAYDRATAEIAPVVAKTQGGSPMAADYARLQWVADCQLSGDTRTARKLIRARLREEGSKGEDAEEADLRRLLGYYGPDGTPNGSTVNRHVEQAAKRLARARGVIEVGELKAGK